jgi:acyl-homoserine-lactone acylase
LELFSKKQMRDAWFSEADILANTIKTEVMTENGFNEKE